MICNVDQQIINTYYTDYKFFFSKPNVEGIGLGYKYTNRTCTYEPSIHVFVSKKISSKCLPVNGIIPSQYKGIKTDVLETGTFLVKNCSCDSSNSTKFAPSYTDRVRPIQPGYCVSVGGMARTGTFGYIATDNEQVSKTYCLLGTATTFSNYNFATIGAQIIQPSCGFGGEAPADTVGKLLKFIPVKISNDPPETLSDYNTIDAGVASYFNVGEVQLLNPFIPQIGIVAGLTTPSLLQSLQWTGSTSGYQRGTVTSISSILKVSYGYLTKAYFKDVIVAGGFTSEYGDSGALVCDLNKKALGLLFANNEGPEGYNVICTIDNIQSMLKISLLTL